MSWFGVACELHRDWRNDIEGLGALFSNHLPAYRNLITSYSASRNDCGGQVAGTVLCAVAGRGRIAHLCAVAGRRKTLNFRAGDGTRSVPATFGARRIAWPTKLKDAGS